MSSVVGVPLVNLNPGASSIGMGGGVSRRPTSHIGPLFRPHQAWICEQLGPAVRHLCSARFFGGIGDSTKFRGSHPPRPARAPSQQLQTDDASFVDHPSANSSTNTTPCDSTVASNEPLWFPSSVWLHKSRTRNVLNAEVGKPMSAHFTCNRCD